jgi:protein SCO1/2
MKRLLLYSLISFIILFILAAFAFAVFQPIKVLPRIRLSPGFLFVDQDGQRLTNEDLRGQVVLYSFAYTRCGERCQPANEAMLQVQQRLDELELGDIPVALVTISVDAQRDNAESLAAYASQLGAEPGVWRFASMENASLLKTIVGAGFEVYYAPKEDGTIALDPAFVLVDGLGIIRGEYHYPTGAPDVERILRHIQALADEAHNSEGAGRLVYEAAHLFLCYAP